MQEAVKVIWRIWKSRADTAARSHESYMNDPEKSRVDTAAQSRKIYEKDLEKSR